MQHFTTETRRKSQKPKIFSRKEGKSKSKGGFSRLSKALYQELEETLDISKRQKGDLKVNSEVNGNLSKSQENLGNRIQLFSPGDSLQFPAVGIIENLLEGCEHRLPRLVLN